jgi:hypothetical protein
MYVICVRRLHVHMIRSHFNMCHARAINIIERVFGRLKGLWVILRSASYFPIKTQCRIIMECALLHNLIFQNMSRDPTESEEQSVANSIEITEGEVSEPEFIMGVSTTNVWTTFRDSLAQGMYNTYRASH